MSLHKGLTQSADLLSNEMKAKLNAGMGVDGYPTGQDRSGRGYKKIQDTIEIGTVQNNGQGDMSITITAGGPEAPMTVAYEYGTPSYEIPVGDEGFLAWKVGPYPNSWKQYSGPILPGKYFRTIKSVTHPEIKAKPFVKPSIEKTAPQIKKILAREFKIEIMSKVEKVTVIKA